MNDQKNTAKCLRWQSDVKKSIKEFMKACREGQKPARLVKTLSCIKVLNIEAEQESGMAWTRDINEYADAARICGGFVRIAESVEDSVMASSIGALLKFGIQNGCFHASILCCRIHKRLPYETPEMFEERKVRLRSSLPLKHMKNGKVLNTEENLETLRLWAGSVFPCAIYEFKEKDGFIEAIHICAGNIVEHLIPEPVFDAQSAAGEAQNVLMLSKAVLEAGNTYESCRILGGFIYKACRMLHMKGKFVEEWERGMGRRQAAEARAASRMHILGKNVTQTAVLECAANISQGMQNLALEKWNAAADTDFYVSDGFPETSVNLLFAAGEEKWLYEDCGGLMRIPEDKVQDLKQEIAKECLMLSSANMRLDVDRPYVISACGHMSMQSGILKAVSRFLPEKPKSP